MHSFHQMCLLAVQLTAHLPSVFAQIPEDDLVPSQDKLVWAAIGDSWASGVSYDIFGRTDYDDNADQCLRINDAWPIQVNANKSWVPTGKQTDFRFSACAGAELANMATTAFMGYVQMDRSGVPDVITMQAGGGDAGFWNVVNNCVFHEQDKNYGPDWPDPNGECAKSLVDSRMRITMTLQRSITDAILDILNYEAVRYNKEFRLYTVGYAPLFAVDELATWCNNQSFVVPWKHQQRQQLSIELRKELNGLIEAVNSKLQTVSEGFNDTRISYIDVSPAFDGARFCECDHSLWDQYTGTKVKLWNASPEGVVLANGPYTVRAPTADEFDNWSKTGLYTSDWQEVVPPQQAIHSGPFQDGKSGVSLRQFHPKQAGHVAIAQAVVARLKEDINPGCDDGCEST